MTCEHLRPLEDEIIAAGLPETFRGRPWSENCREWVYFACYFDRESIRKRSRVFVECPSCYNMMTRIYQGGRNEINRASSLVNPNQKGARPCQPPPCDCLASSVRS
jgi:hypothetical protein